MHHTGPHISIDSSHLITRTLGVSRAELAGWPEDVQDLAASLAGEMFLVRYNPFIDPELVRRSVSESFRRAKHALSGDYEAILSLGMARFWKEFDGDQAFRRELVERLSRFMDAECIVQSPNSLVECSTDATDLRMELPMLVLTPKTVPQIQGVVRLAGELGFSIIPRGGGTGLTGGAIPASLRTVVLSLNRLKGITLVDPRERVLCTEAGVLTQNAIKAAADQGFLFTVDPASKAGSSIGGNISENSGGPFAFEYGTTLDNILSFRMVRADGTLIEVKRKDHPRHKIMPGETATFEIYEYDGSGRPERARLADTVALTGDEIRAPGLGKDVTDKYLGGLPGVQKEGVDGIIVDACFVCHPQPAHSRVLCLEFFGRSMHNATLVIKDIVALRDRIRTEGDKVKISALEEFGTKYVQAIEYRKKSLQYEGEPISVLTIQLDSDDPDALDRSVADILDIADPYDNVDIFAARDDKEGELFWEDRHKLSAISKRTSGFKINEDVVIPLESIPEFSAFIEGQNVYFLARAYRRALRAVQELPEVTPEDEFLDMEIDFATQLMKRTWPGPEMNDQELEVQTYFFFQDLKGRYPKAGRAIGAAYERMLMTRIVIANHMHAGDGNNHVNLPVNSNDPAMLAEAHEAVDRVIKKVLELGGVVSGEHGIGITKIAFLSEDKIKALRDYKKAVDPKNILNPAKLTQREPIVEPYTFSFNRLIQDLRKTALPDKERLINLLTAVQTCNRCGKCKQACPMYYPQRGLEYHPRNKNISLGALAEAIYYSQVNLGAPDKKLLDELRRIVDHCTACGKCTGACSVKIKTAEVTLDMRAFLEEKGAGGHPVKSKILGFLADDPGKRLPLAAKALSLGATAQRSGIKLVPEAWRARFENPLLQAPGPLIGYQSLVETLHLGRSSVFVPRAGFTGEAVFYFPGCGANLFRRSIGLAAVGLLLKAGVAVAMPEDHRCCGYPLLVSGREKDYEANRARNVEAVAGVFARAAKAGLRLGHVLTSCGSCREGLSSYELAGPDGPPARQDVVQFLLGSPDRLARLGRLPEGAVPSRLLYHPSCHAEWVGLPVAKASETYRAGLARLLGTTVVLTPGCCAESGLGALTSPAIYNKLRERKMEQLTRDLAGIDPAAPILVGCPSCRVGIERSLLQLGPDWSDRQVRHTLEYLAELLYGPKWKAEVKRIARSASGDAGRQAAAETEDARS